MSEVDETNTDYSYFTRRKCNGQTNDLRVLFPSPGELIMLNWKNGRAPLGYSHLIAHFDSFHDDFNPEEGIDKITIVMEPVTSIENAFYHISAMRGFWLFDAGRLNPKLGVIGIKKYEIIYRPFSLHFERAFAGNKEVLEALKKDPRTRRYTHFFERQIHCFADSRSSSPKGQ